MEMKQVILENVSIDEFSRVLEMYEGFIKAQMSEVKRFFHIREEHLGGLATHIKGIIVEEFKEQGLFTDEDMKKTPENEPPRYKEFMNALMEIVKSSMIIMVSSETNFKWFATISKSQSMAAHLELEDKTLMIAFSNTARTIGEYNMTLHVPSEQSLDKLEAIDLHFNKDTKEVNFTSCKLGAPIMELYIHGEQTIPSKEKNEDGSTSLEIIKGVHVLTIAYGDAGSMYHDILLQLCDMTPFEKMEICIRRFQEDNPQLIPVDGLEDLKEKVFNLQSQMRWYGIIESSKDTKK